MSKGKESLIFNTPACSAAAHWSLNPMNEQNRQENRQEKLSSADSFTCRLCRTTSYHRAVVGLSVTARWKYSGKLSPCRLPLGSLQWTLVDRVLLKLLFPSARSSRLDTIISARSCWSRWKFSL